MRIDEGTVERIGREQLAGLVDDIAPEAIELDLDMADAYGLGSLDKVLFLTAMCDETGVPLSRFTEQDLAEMRTLRDVRDAFARDVEVGA